VRQKHDIARIGCHDPDVANFLASDHGHRVADDPVCERCGHIPAEHGNLIANDIGTAGADALRSEAEPFVPLSVFFPDHC